MKKIQNVNEMINNQKKTGSKTPIIIASVCCVVVIAVVSIFLLKEKRPNISKADEGGGYVINEENVDEIKEDMSQQVKDGYFETYMNTEWTFSTCTEASTDAMFGNSPNNKKPIQCTVTLDTTGEEVYESGVLNVGDKLSSIKLSKNLSKGTYPATCNVKLLDKQDDGTYKEYSNAGFAITITVQK